MNIETDDVDDINDPSIPILDTRPGPYSNVMGASDNNQYGRNAIINLAFILAGVTKVDVEVWLNAEPTRPKLSTDAPAGSSSSSSSSSSSASPTGFWVLVNALTVGPESTFFVVEGIPPGEYKLKVKNLTGGNLSIIEGHAA